MTQAEGTDDLVNSAMLQNDLEQLRTRSVGCGSTTRKERKRSEHKSIECYKPDSLQNTNRKHKVETRYKKSTSWANWGLLL